MNSPTLQMYGSKNIPTWCPGCGDFGIWMAIKKALVNLDIFPHEVLFVFDVGCGGNMSDKISGYCYHSLHGRVLPLAAGAYLANPNVKIIGFGGDGANYGEGVNHLLNTFRSNYDITMVIHNNGNYGLTTGQASPTTCQGTPMNGNASGVIEAPLDPIALAMSVEGTFIGRGFTSDVDHLVSLFEAAIIHRGFSFLDIIQACPTYDRTDVYEGNLAKRKNIENIAGYDKHDYKKCFDYHLTHRDEEVTAGILYQNKASKPYLESVANRINTSTALHQEVSKRDISTLLQELV